MSIIKFVFDITKDKKQNLKHDNIDNNTDMFQTKTTLLFICSLISTISVLFGYYPSGRTSSQVYPQPQLLNEMDNEKTETKQQ